MRSNEAGATRQEDLSHIPNHCIVGKGDQPVFSHESPETRPRGYNNSRFRAVWQRVGEEA
jgi:hypothetical protein